MRLWTVHEPRNPASVLERADKTHFVKDGFSWPGFLVPLPWLLVKRLWLGLLIYAAIAIGCGLLGAFLPLTQGAGFVLAILGNLYVGLDGNDLRRRKLAAQNYVHAGSVLAKSGIEAERIFFAERGDAEPVPAAPPPRSPALRTRETDDVLGVFPRPEVRR